MIDSAIYIYKGDPFAVSDGVCVFFERRYMHALQQLATITTTNTNTNTYFYYYLKH